MSLEVNLKVNQLKSQEKTRNNCSTALTLGGLAASAYAVPKAANYIKGTAVGDALRGLNSKFIQACERGAASCATAAVKGGYGCQGILADGTRIVNKPKILDLFKKPKACLGAWATNVLDKLSLKGLSSGKMWRYGLYGTLTALAINTIVSHCKKSNEIDQKYAA